MLKFFQNILTKYKSHRNDQLMTSIYTGNQAVMNRFGRDIYLSDLVNNCINRIAKEAGKIKIVSVVDTGDKVQPQNDDISRLFRFQPNPLQTTKDFLESVEWLKLKTRHCWIFRNGRRFTTRRASPIATIPPSIRLIRPVSRWDR